MAKYVVNSRLSFAINMNLVENIMSQISQLLRSIKTVSATLSQKQTQKPALSNLMLNIKMFLQYLSFSISLVFLSFIVGMVMTALIRRTNFYNTTLSNLNFVKSDMTNKIIGVGIVQWIVKNTFFKFLNQKLKFDRKMSISDIKNIRNEMTKSEVDHLFAFIFFTIVIIVQLYNQKYLLAFTMLFVNIIMNLYPSLLQQKNKRRIDKLILNFENDTPKV